MHKRNELIDIMRGIAVVEVVCAHSIQRALAADRVYGYNIIYRFADYNMMFLFFMISGCLLSLTDAKLSLKYVGKKIRQLIVTTYLWSFIVYWFAQYDFAGEQLFIDFAMPLPDYLLIILKNPLYIYWTLYVLFLFIVMALILKNIAVRVENKPWFVTVILLFGGVFVNLQYIVPNLNYLGGSYMRRYFPFFVLGFAMHQLSIRNRKKYELWTLAIGYCGMLSFLGEDIRYIRAVLLIVPLYFLGKIIEEKGVVLKKFLMLQGKFSLEIYMMSLCLLNIGIGSGYIRCVTNYVFVTAITTGLAYFISKNSKAKKLLFGR